MKHDVEEFSNECVDREESVISMLYCGYNITKMKPNFHNNEVVRRYNYLHNIDQSCYFDAKLKFKENENGEHGYGYWRNNKEFIRVVKMMIENNKFDFSMVDFNSLVKSFSKVRLH